MGTKREGSNRDRFSNALKNLLPDWSGRRMEIMGTREIDDQSSSNLKELMQAYGKYRDKMESGMMEMETTLGDKGITEGKVNLIRVRANLGNGRLFEKVNEDENHIQRGCWNREALIIIVIRGRCMASR